MRVAIFYDLPGIPLSNGNPNLVEGRELYSPQGIAVDTSANPPILYVADTGNNRVMVWKNATQFSNGGAPDLIIGQKDPYSTQPQGPGTSASIGLNTPTGLAVKDGDLYVADTGNNRILRFPKPTTQQDQFPDMVIGQPNFKSREANQGNILPAKSTIQLANSSGYYRCSLAFDTAGNLWITDPGNHRVLRYPVDRISKGESGPEANLVLGQTGYETVAAVLPVNAASQQLKDRLQLPDGLVFDAKGRLFVSDALSRVLVYEPPSRDNQAAVRIMGVTTGAKTQIQIDRTFMAGPSGLFMVAGSSLGVVDSASSRILIFEPFDQWPGEDIMLSPQARYVVGQGPSTYNEFNIRKPNNGLPEATENTLSLPAAAVFAGGELYIADGGNHRVIVMPQQGNYFAGATRVLGQYAFDLSSPNLIEGREFDFTLSSRQGTLADAGIAVDQHSDPPRLYVADPYNNRVLGFKDVRGVRPGDRADIVIGQPDMFRGLCNYPSNDLDKPNSSGLCRPVGIAVDFEGNLWVADSGNGRVLRFPSPFAHEGSLPAADLVLGQTGFSAKITDPTARTMASPYGLAFAGDEGVLVSDATHHRVLLFPKKDGAYATGTAATKVFGQSSFNSSDQSNAASAEDNRMRAPRHISTDTDGRLYVADTGNNRILIFDQVAFAPASDARAAVALGSLSAPRGVYVSPQTGDIWVTDTGNNRALHYPRYDYLPFTGFAPDKTAIPAASATLAVAQDQFGSLMLADASNRLAIYYPGLKAINAAHQLENRPLAPGIVAYLYPQSGGNFGSDTADVKSLPNPLPWPFELADIQVLVNESPAALSYVSPGQINIMVPTGAPTGGTAEFQVVKKSTGQILASGPVNMNVAAPGLFTVNNNGTGQVVANNQDGSANTPSNAAARGSVISLFGTGQGPVAGAPPDGEAPAGPTPTADTPRVIIGTCFVDDPGPGCEGEAGNLVYSGLAAGLVGTWQIDVKIPKATAPGATVAVVVVYKSQPSNGGDPKRVATTIAVKQ